MFPKQKRNDMGYTSAQKQRPLYYKWKSLFLIAVLALAWSWNSLYQWNCEIVFAPYRMYLSNQHLATLVMLSENLCNSSRTGTMDIYFNVVYRLAVPLSIGMYVIGRFMRDMFWTEPRIFLAEPGIFWTEPRIDPFGVVQRLLYRTIWYCWTFWLDNSLGWNI